MKRTAGELAQYLGARLEGDAGTLISGVASPENARAEDLIYLASPRHADRAAESAARCVLAPEGARLAGKTVVEVQHPKLAFAKAAAWLIEQPAAASEARSDLPHGRDCAGRETWKRRFGGAVRGDRRRRGNRRQHCGRAILFCGPRG